MQHFGFWFCGILSFEDCCRIVHLLCFTKVWIDSNKETSVFSEVETSEDMGISFLLKSITKKSSAGCSTWTDRLLQFRVEHTGRHSKETYRIKQNCSQTPDKMEDMLFLESRGIAWVYCAAGRQKFLD